MNKEKSQMNALLSLLDPLLPTLKPNNRDKFWSKNRRELDRIGWSGRFIDSDSEDEDELEREEMSQGSKSNDGEEIANVVAESEVEDAESEKKDDNDEDRDDILSSEERYAEESIVEVIVALLFFIVVQGGVLCIVRLIV
ncbi:uncharacterized protein M437DRAFT_69427 [Aureobasidium melanogenum CBS 110374]|uniref:Uncharacterized protein n=1 Tax=Aureobasidium melanogenum (strain CBS 110374) TaxID=1043003 RepID=A0A074VEC8_AURM1|nr:uncharacterized protein M437DRAFT_69427 [Aureobasidium melanogenum CBS 110374]KEQ59070.1 hypothetical protein M437DRAFT_69427 [Aureobasidium melanogenum CBS 110374]